MTNIRSERGGNSKLTNSQVVKLRKLLSTKEYTYAQMAERFGVSESAIKKVASRTTWAN